MKYMHTSENDISPLMVKILWSYLIDSTGKEV